MNLSMNPLIYTTSWYLLVSLLGWLTFPLIYRLMPNLPDRGFSFARILGLLLWGYVFWLLASFRVLFNNAGGLLFGVAVLAALSFWAYRGINRADLKKWWDSQRGMVIIVEILFLASFILMVIIRAANPEIEGTEKPMELAFINAILSSPTFPPHDPWLSGYAISYYYFGYVLVAMLAKLTAVPGNFAFNLGIALVFALSSVGAYGLVYNLVKFRYKGKRALARLYALLGPLFILIISNLEGFLHSLHSRGLFWSLNENGGYSSPFWQWLDIKDLNVPPTEPFSWIPSNFWWWWRASRVLQDYNYARSPLEIIDEFPFFSFLLGDLHPHVLGIPFAILVMALALHILLSSTTKNQKRLHLQLNFRTFAWILVFGAIFSSAIFIVGILNLRITLITIGLTLLILTIAGAWYLSPSISQNGWGIFTKDDLEHMEINTPLHIDLRTILLSGVLVGGMAFLNTWDVLVAVALIAGAYTLGGVYIRGDLKVSGLVKDFILISVLSGITAFFFYLPFYIGFSSQAGGPLPNLIFPTRGPHLWVMFGPLLIPLFAFLIYLWKKEPGQVEIKKSAALTLSILLILLALSLLLGIIAVNLPEIRGIEVGSFYLNFLGAPDGGSLFKESIIRRITNPGGWITLALLLFTSLSLLLKLGKNKNQSETPFQPPTSKNLLKIDSFILLLILIGVMLAIGVEFIYLRDQFGWRMNTIFKFYYQIWLLWGIAAAYGISVLLKELRSPWSVIFRIGLVVLIGMSIIYPILGLWSKTNGFQPVDGWTLDGTAFLERRSPEEMDAIRWLQSAPAGVVAEAVSPTGGSYQWPPGYARVSTLSGLPAVLGWMGHLSQWRGGNDEMGTRQPDLERLYCSRQIEESNQILERYNIRYVYVGPLERSTYQANEGSCPAGVIDVKFDNSLILVFNNGVVRIYEVPGTED